MSIMSEPLDKPAGNAEATAGPPAGNAGHPAHPKKTSAGSPKPALETLAPGKDGSETAKPSGGPETDKGGQAGGPAASSEEGKQATLPPLDDNDKQAIAFLRVKGVSQNAIVGIYGPGRRRGVGVLRSNTASGGVALDDLLGRGGGPGSLTGRAVEFFCRA